MTALATPYSRAWLDIMACLLFGKVAVGLSVASWLLVLNQWPPSQQLAACCVLAAVITGVLASYTERSWLKAVAWIVPPAVKPVILQNNFLSGGAQGPMQFGRSLLLAADASCYVCSDTP